MNIVKLFKSFFLKKMETLSAKEIHARLITQNIIGAKGVVSMKLLNVRFNLSGKSAVGDLLQEWLENWLKKEKIFFRLNKNTQEPPDFYLSKKDTEDLLEVKVFDYSKSPNFDVANFDTYIRSLQDKSYKIDADYLIIGYSLDNNVITIKNIWLKKIWELCRPSEKLPLNAQIKQNKIVNIRPAIWYSEKTKFKPFKTKKQFLIALNETILKYIFLSREIKKDTWLKTVEKDYKKHTGSNLID